MAQTSIFGPFFGMMLLTGLVWVYMYVRRIAFIRGLIPEPFSGEAEKSDEERLAEELAALAEAKLKGA